MIGIVWDSYSVSQQIWIFLGNSALFWFSGFRIEFSEEKNLLLKETRGVGFEDVVTAIEEQKILGDIKHSNKKYGHQRILVIKREGYAYVVPYVIDLKRKIVFLKTVYPSRVLTVKYMKGGVKK